MVNSSRETFSIPCFVHSVRSFAQRFARTKHISHIITSTRDRILFETYERVNGRVDGVFIIIIIVASLLLLKQSAYARDCGIGSENTEWTFLQGQFGNIQGCFHFHQETNESLLFTAFVCSLSIHEHRAIACTAVRMSADFTCKLFTFQYLSLSRIVYALGSRQIQTQPRLQTEWRTKKRKKNSEWDTCFLMNLIWKRDEWIRSFIASFSFHRDVARFDIEKRFSTLPRVNRRNLPLFFRWK